ELGQPLSHVEAGMAGRLTLDPGCDLPTLLQIKTRRLKVECGQHRARTAAVPCFFLCHGEDPAAKPAAPQMLRQEEPVYPQKPKRCTAQQAPDDSLGIRIPSEDKEGPPIRVCCLRLLVGA